MLTLLLLLVTSSTQAQQYPDHPVRVIVGYTAGSGPDIQARTGRRAADNQRQRAKLFSEFMQIVGPDFVL